VSESSAATGAPTARTKTIVLVLLTIVSTLNFLDRQIVNILAEPIKHDLKLNDGQLGIITGLSFALFYSILGIPIARMADRSHRPAIIATALFVWSAATAACGLAASFATLLLARVGVAAGEAGATPPSHSLLSDFTVPANRASALAIFSLGTPIGSLIGLAAGGLISDALGWRWAFFLAAAPGILLAPVIREGQGSGASVVRCRRARAQEQAFVLVACGGCCDSRDRDDRARSVLRFVFPAPTQRSPGRTGAPPGCRIQRRNHPWCGDRRQWHRRHAIGRLRH
jgi:MFS family permease